MASGLCVEHTDLHNFVLLWSGEFGWLLEQRRVLEWEEGAAAVGGAGGFKKAVPEVSELPPWVPTLFFLLLASHARRQLLPVAPAEKGAAPSLSHAQPAPGTSW